MASGWKSVNVENSNIPLYVSVPETHRTVPGIVVVHGKSGLEEFIKDTTRMFAQLGYAAVAPNLYHRDGPDCKDDADTRKARLRDPSIIRDIEGAPSVFSKLSNESTAASWASSDFAWVGG